MPNHPDQQAGFLLLNQSDLQARCWISTAKPGQLRSDSRNPTSSLKDGLILQQKSNIQPEGQLQQKSNIQPEGQINFAAEI